MPSRHAHPGENRTAEARTTPRKKPRQVRSKVTVEALLGATARILVREGYAGTSTSKIAREAGVSVGSLYQYFPSKEAIVGELVENFHGRSLALFDAQLARAVGLPLETLVAGLVDAMLADHRENPALNRVILEQVPNVGRRGQWLDHQKDLAERVVRCLEGYREQLKVTDLELAAFLLVHAVESIMHATFARRPEYLEQPRFALELRRIILGYLSSEVRGPVPSP
jgi:AcrR family transcriptional regulator